MNEGKRWPWRVRDSCCKPFQILLHTTNTIYVYINQYQMHNKYETLFIFTLLQFQLNQSSVIPFYPFSQCTMQHTRYTHNPLVGSLCFVTGANKLLSLPQTWIPLSFALWHKSAHILISSHFHLAVVFSVSGPPQNKRTPGMPLSISLLCVSLCIVSISYRTYRTVQIHLFRLMATYFCQNIC